MNKDFLNYVKELDDDKFKYVVFKKLLYENNKIDKKVFYKLVDLMNSVWLTNFAMYEILQDMTRRLCEKIVDDGFLNEAIEYFIKNDNKKSFKFFFEELSIALAKRAHKDSFIVLIVDIKRLEDKLLLAQKVARELSKRVDFKKACEIVEEIDKKREYINEEIFVCDERVNFFRMVLKDFALIRVLFEYEKYEEAIERFDKLLNFIAKSKKREFKMFLIDVLIRLSDLVEELIDKGLLNEALMIAKIGVKFDKEGKTSLSFFKLIRNMIENKMYKEASMAAKYVKDEEYKQECFVEITNRLLREGEYDLMAEIVLNCDDEYIRCTRIPLLAKIFVLEGKYQKASKLVENIKHFSVKENEKEVLKDLYKYLNEKGRK